MIRGREELVRFGYLVSMIFFYMYFDFMNKFLNWCRNKYNMKEVFFKVVSLGNMVGIFFLEECLINFVIFV